jgi:hypothetical protein
MEPSLLCVYPLSPTLLPLHRYLYYISLLLSVLYPTPPPLIKGAFAYSLTTACTASLYSLLIIALPSSSSNAPLNLDIFALFAILSPAAISLLPFLHWNANLAPTSSKTGHRNPGRVIVRIWGLFVAAGAICAFIGIVRAHSLSPIENGSIEQCLAPAHSKLLLRNPEGVETAQYERIFGPLYGYIVRIVSVLTFLPLIFGLVGCLTNRPYPYFSRPNSSSNPCDNSQDEIYIDATILPHPTSSPLSFLSATYLRLRGLVTALSPGMLIVVLVLNEIFLLKNWGTEEGVPEEEEMFEVGQWGVWVGLGFVSAAAVVNWVVGKGRQRAREYGVEEVFS